MLPRETWNKLVEMLQHHFNSNHVLDQWRDIRVVPIPKRSGNLDNIQNYRPISLISVLAKSINMCVKDVLTKYLESKKMIPPRSFAYRKGKSAPMCLNECLHAIETAKHQKLKVFVCALDLSNAYNCVDIVKLMSQLKAYKVHPSICGWVYNFLHRRVLMLGRSRVIVENGLPQGSCLSPLLFNVYTAGLHKFEDNQTQIFQFADDFLILSHNRIAAEALRGLESKVAEFQNACEDLGLLFNVNKTKFMYLARGCKNAFTLRVCNTNIVQVGQIQFLGRVITAGGVLKDHVLKIKKDIRPANNLIKRLTTVKTGLTPKVALNTYKAFVRAKAEYGCTTWANAPAGYNNKIQVCINGTIRRCLGVPPSAPIHSMFALAGELPPLFRAQWLTGK